MLHKLNGQEKISGNVRRVDYVHDDIGLVLFEIIADDLLFLRAGVNRISAGQIYDGNFSAVVFDDADFLVDGDARPISDFLARARKFIKNCGLAGVGVAGQGDG